MARKLLQTKTMQLKLSKNNTLTTKTSSKGGTKGPVAASTAGVRGQSDVSSVGVDGKKTKTSGQEKAAC